MLNNRQKMCLWAGIALVVLMGLFPPWCYQTGPNSDYRYGFLLSPPGLDQYHMSRFRLDMERLCVQWILVAVITGGLVVTYHKKSGMG